MNPIYTKKSIFKASEKWENNKIMYQYDIHLL